ncbi:MAG: hypothetical protein GX297_09885 [Treponema sp.]|nr:hypothetical protein [Treponema sp.]
MVLNFILVFIPISIGMSLAVLTSGGTFGIILDVPNFLVIFFCFVILIFISGYGKYFRNIFISKKKFKNLSLEELQKTELSLDFAEKILLAIASFFTMLYLIYLFANCKFSDYNFNSFGSDIAVIILPIVYICIFSLIIVSMKLKVHKSIILYMAETDEKTDFSENQKINVKFVIKLVISIFLCISIFCAYDSINIKFSWRKYSLIGLVTDFPFITIFAVTVLPLIAISENMGNYFRSIKTIFSNKKINISQKNQYLSVLKNTARLNWYTAVSSMMIGWIGILNYLEDKTLLYINIAVSLIPIFYAVILNFLLLIIEIRVNKVSE